jgi:hypothetical protein
MMLHDSFLRCDNLCYLALLLSAFVIHPFSPKRSLARQIYGKAPQAKQPKMSKRHASPSHDDQPRKALKTENENVDNPEVRSTSNLSFKYQLDIFNVPLSAHGVPVKIN